MFQEYDVVVLTQKDPVTPLPVGTQGTVLICHGDDHYEVEFMGKKEESLGTYTVSGQNLRINRPQSGTWAIAKYGAAFLLLFPLVLIGLFLGLSYWAMSPVCEENVVFSTASPQQHFAGMMALRGCGATTANASVISVAKRVRTGIAEKETVLVIENARPVSIAWEGETLLVVHVPRGAKMFFPERSTPTVSVKVVEE